MAVVKSQLTGTRVCSCKQILISALLEGILCDVSELYLVKVCTGPCIVPLSISLGTDRNRAK